MKTAHASPWGSFEGFLAYLWQFIQTDLIFVLAMALGITLAVLLHSIRKDCEAIRKGYR